MTAAGLLMAGLALTAQGKAENGVSPQELVQDTSSRMLTAMRNERQAIAGNPGRLYELVAEIVLPYFDFEKMSMWVLGRNWHRATPDQRVRFVEEFRTLLVRTYGSALSRYADEKVVYLPFTGDTSGRTVTVRTEIEQAGNAIPISYSMYSSDDGWKVYDVAISGVSLVTNYRSSFGNIIRHKGMDELIRELQEKNGQPAGG